MPRKRKTYYKRKITTDDEVANSNTSDEEDLVNLLQETMKSSTALVKGKTGKTKSRAKSSKEEASDNSKSETFEEENENANSDKVTKPESSAMAGVHIQKKSDQNSNSDFPQYIEILSDEEDKEVLCKQDPGPQSKNFNEKNENKETDETNYDDKYDT